MKKTITANTLHTLRLGHSRRLLVVPVTISRQKKFMLAVKIESRNGLMYKHLPFAPFGEEKLPLMRTYVGKPVDIRIAKNVRCEACGQPFKPSEGYSEQKQEPTYSYCAECCHW